MNAKLEIPGETVVITKGERLGYVEGDTKVVVPNPDVVGIASLRESLASRGWLAGDHDVYDPRTKFLKRKVISTSRDIREDTMVPEYDLTDMSGFIALGGAYSNPDVSDQDRVNLYNEELDEFLDLYNKYIMVKEDNIGEYNRLISTRDMLGNTSEVCLLCPKDGAYTSIVNLNSVLLPSSSEKSRTPSQIRVVIAYSKGSKMFSKDVLIPTSGQDNYITTGQSDFTLEFSDGCLRVFPESQEVTECVISYCFLTYEYLI